MPEQPPPTDDLYARLGVTRSATRAQIDAAWRDLMKLHHPDVAGPLSTELAQRINVARDWLADPGRRARYDAATTRQPRRRRPSGGSAPPRGRPASAPRPARAAPLPRFDPWTADYGPESEAVRAFLRSVVSLPATTADRLAAGPGSPIVDAIPGFLPDDRRAGLERVEAALAVLLPADVRRRPSVVTAILGRAFAIALDDVVASDELVAHLLSDAWQAAAGPAAT